MIKVAYLGEYPALGCRGGEDGPTDILARVKELAERVLLDSSVNDFLDFALNDDVDWNVEAQALLTR